MSRSRLVLLAAWGLLAAGTAVQFIRVGDDPDTPASLPTWAPADAGGTGDAAPRPTPELAVGEAADDRLGPHGDDEAAAGPVPSDQVIDVIDDPAHWPQVLVAPEALVATVTGGGIASLAEPGPGDPVHWFPNPTQFGGPRTFLVTDADSSPDYVKVSLPVMPNGQEGWLPRDAVELSTVSHRAEVDLSDTTVTVWDGTDLVVTTRAVTGRPATPTPVGRFYIRDIIAQPDPGGDFGPWILALSGFSEVLTTFDGGLPALALHGTDRPDHVGSALSSGCVRVPNEIITLLAETVPLGTPVTIVA